MNYKQLIYNGVKVAKVNGKQLRNITVNGTLYEPIPSVTQLYTHYIRTSYTVTSNNIPETSRTNSYGLRVKVPGLAPYTAETSQELFEYLQANYPEGGPANGTYWQAEYSATSLWHWQSYTISHWQIEPSTVGGLQIAFYDTSGYRRTAMYTVSLDSVEIPHNIAISFRDGDTTANVEFTIITESLTLFTVESANELFGLLPTSSSTALAATGTTDKGTAVTGVYQGSKHSGDNTCVLKPSSLTWWISDVESLTDTLDIS